MTDYIMFIYCFSVVFCVVYLIKIKALRILIDHGDSADELSIAAESQPWIKLVLGGILAVVLMILCAIPFLNLITVMSLCDQMDEQKKAGKK